MTTKTFIPKTFFELPPSNLKDGLTKKEIIAFLQIVNKAQIIGSYANPDILYPSDVDLQQYITVGAKGDHELLKEFQEKYQIALSNKDIYITDFKCGVHNSEPLRWDSESIEQGYQFINDNRKISFISALNMVSTIKLDVIAFIDDEFVEFSCNYYLTHDINGKIHTSYLNKEVDDVELSFKLDIIKYQKEGNYYKALKRLMTLQKLQKKNVDKYVKFFNSKIGKLNYQLNSINIIVQVMDNNFRDVPMHDIQKHLAIIDKDLDTKYKKSQHWINIMNSNITHEDMYIELNDIASVIEDDVNDGVLKWIKR
jgi:hypothetical protein